MWRPVANESHSVQKEDGLFAVYTTPLMDKHVTYPEELTLTPLLTISYTSSLDDPIISFPSFSTSPSTMYPHRLALLSFLHYIILGTLFALDSVSVIAVMALWIAGTSVMVVLLLPLLRDYVAQRGGGMEVAAKAWSIASKAVQVIPPPPPPSPATAFNELNTERIARGMRDILPEWGTGKPPVVIGNFFDQLDGKRDGPVADLRRWVVDEAVHGMSGVGVDGEEGRG